MLGFGNWLAGISLVVASDDAGALGSAAAPDFPLWPHLMKILAILSGMVGVLFLALFLWKRVAPRFQRHPALIQVLATHYPAPRQALILVAVGQERFLLASSTGNLSVIPLAVEQAGVPPQSLPPQSLPPQS